MRYFEILEQGVEESRRNKKRKQGKTNLKVGTNVHYYLGV